MQLVAIENRRKTRYRGIVVAIMLACILALVAVLVFDAAEESTKEQGALSVRQSIIDSAMQCAAIEGSFPNNLAYLEDNYGLVVDHDDYNVIYEVLGGNVMPSVVVVPR